MRQVEKPKTSNRRVILWISRAPSQSFSFSPLFISVSFWCGYRTDEDILYLGTLLNNFSGSNHFQVDGIGFRRTTITHFENHRAFSSFPTFIPHFVFWSLPCPAPLVQHRIAVMMTNIHSSPASTLSMLSRLFCRFPFLYFINVFSELRSLRILIRNGSVKFLYWIYQDEHVFFFFFSNLLMSRIIVVDFSNVESALQS